MKPIRKEPTPSLPPKQEAEAMEIRKNLEKELTVEELKDIAKYLELLRDNNPEATNHYNYLCDKYENDIGMIRIIVLILLLSSLEKGKLKTETYYL